MTPAARFVAVAVLVLTTSFGEAAFRDDMTEDDSQWVRLCTLTSNGSSQLNVTMPCGIRIEGESDDHYRDKNHNEVLKLREGSFRAGQANEAVDGGHHGNRRQGKPVRAVTIRGGQCSSGEVKIRK